MSEFKHPNKHILVAEPIVEVFSQATGLISFSLTVGNNLTKIVPPENIYISNKSLLNIIQNIDKYPPLDLVVFDAYMLKLSGTYELTERFLDSSKTSFHEFFLEDFVDFDKPDEGIWGMALGQLIDMYKQKIKGFRGMVLSLGSLDKGKPMMAKNLEKLLPCFNIYQNSGGTLLDPFLCAMTMDEVLTHRDFAARREIRRKKNKDDVKKTVIKVFGEVVIRYMAADEIDQMNDENGKKREGIITIPMAHVSMKDSLVQSIKESETILVDMGYESHKGAKTILYLRDGYETFHKKGVRQGDAEDMELAGKMQIPPKLDNLIECNIPGIRTSFVSEGEESELTFFWVKEINRWLVHEEKERIYELNKDTRKILADIYRLPEKKEEAIFPDRFKPSELRRLARNSSLPNNREFIRNLLVKCGFQKEAESEWFEENIENIELRPSRYIIERGFTGLGVLINSEWAIKFDEMPRMGNEHRIYSSMHLEEFSPLLPKIKGFSTREDGQYGALIMENLANRKRSGEAIARDIAQRYGLCPDGTVNLNLFMMGLFHKCASRDERLRAKLQQVGYEDKRGIIHPVAGNIPLDDISNEALKRFKETWINVGKVIGIIDNYNAILKADQEMGRLSVIHGDWKPSNIVNGHIVDYAMVGLAKEIDEIAFFMSDSYFQASLDNYHQAINAYIHMREKHDPDFQIRMYNKGREEINTLADSAWLRQLVLRHSVMKKRDLADDSKYKQRKYYQQKINEVLKEGKFL